jgi:hypothetical protein
MQEAAEACGSSGGRGSVRRRRRREELLTQLSGVCTKRPCAVLLAGADGERIKLMGGLFC